MKIFSTFITEFLQITQQSKYRDIYISICQRGAERGNNRKQLKELLKYVEGHHFIPKCVTKEYALEQHNIVFLTAREHFICHYLLCKIFKKTEYYFSLLSAFGKMSSIAPSMKHMRYMNSHLYEHFRKNVSSLMSQMRRGKVRIKREGITKEILKDDLDLYLEDGWETGAASTEEARLSRIAANKKRTGFIWMHFAGNEKSFHVDKDNVDYMLSQGAVVGRKFSEESMEKFRRSQRLAKAGKVSVTDGITLKRVTPEEALKLLSQGWRKGVNYIQLNRGGFCRKGAVFYNDGIKNYRMMPQEAESKGLIRGRLKITRCHLSATQS